ncbi:formate dehydrogenase major subunit [Desulfobaculum bizertense DSM 18034]|uniref:Formate dehydrogenase major subunit n=3 Tax=Desulfobaculum TaxID=1433996 RepID=A0A1T4WN98_9BACT|nr:formate dehydrogenase major subunit [Desulfobaculum bizertense DSM 18034]
MTNHWIDLKNSDRVLIMGSNAAENHPISFKWVLRAKDRGAKVIHVDPRFTRTSTKADIYAPIRSGSDIGFLGGFIKYILEKKLYFKEYVVNNTNAAFIVKEGFGFKDGIFTGYNSETSSYDKSSWDFEYESEGVPRRDETLKHPRCVFQLLKKHYSRYTLDKVESVTGTSKEDLLKVYSTYAESGKPDQAGTIMYAMGWTQHTVGVQNIRTMCIIQLLLGNIGIAGGGVNALRGESNVQGSTDQCLLWHILPGYLGIPKASYDGLNGYIDTLNAKNIRGAKDPKSAAWWQNYPKYMSSFLKAMYPDVEPKESYEWMPKVDDGVNYSWLNLFERMDKGDFKGFFAWGQNPACGGANSNKTRLAMAELDWMVNVNIFDNETGSFWHGPGMDPKKVKTECFFLPCAVSIEKEGSITNSGRWMQWRYQGPDPWGNTRPDGEIIAELMEKVKKLYEKEDGAFKKPVLGLGTKLWKGEHGIFDPHSVAKLINGYFLKDVTIKGKKFRKGQLVPSFAFLQDDGSTSSGNWLYCQSYTEKGNMAARRDTTQTPEQAKIGLYPNWAWCWPVNRRIIYNRASVNPKGQPYAPQKAVIAWKDGKWIGDVPDGGWAPGSKYPFIMLPSGHGHIFGPGRADGPFPEYYEPMECPIDEHPFSKQLNNPTALQFKKEYKAVCDPRYPFICSTYRVTEHWQSGIMTRYTPWLLEAEPQMFCEMNPEMAKMKGIKNGDKVIVENTRGKLWAIAIVTPRLRPFKVMGKTVHMVGIPWHFGWVFPKDGGDAANLLTPSVGDPNTGIPETKAFMVNVRKA